MDMSPSSTENFRAVAFVHILLDLFAQSGLFVDDGFQVIVKTAPMKEKYGKDLTPHQVEYRMVKR